MLNRFQFRGKRVLLVGSLIGLFLLAMLAPAEDRSVSAAQVLGRYCSMTWLSGDWGLAWYSNLTDDPCAFIKSKKAPGGTIQRAGLYAVNGVNNVVVRCNTNASWVWLGIGTGDGPLKYTFDQATSQKQRSCIFTASPRELPIFNTPFPALTGTTPGTGFDFARAPYKTLNLKDDFGQPGASTAATKVDWKARDKSQTNFIDDHDGYDIGILTGTSLLAVADGIVLAARFRDVTNACPDGPSATQGEIFLKHTVSGGASQFNEQFGTYYGHLSSIKVKAGDTVKQGQVIGLSGNTGCSSGPHLHITTFRITNTASYLEFPVKINTDFSMGKDQNSANTYKVSIDPYGFYPPAGFDPWAWKAYPSGALSVNLWASNQAPPTGNW